MLVQFLINIKTKFGNSVILRKKTDKMFQTIRLNPSCAKLCRIVSIRNDPADK